MTKKASSLICKCYCVCIFVHFICKYEHKIHIYMRYILSTFPFFLGMPRSETNRFFFFWKLPSSTSRYLENIIFYGSCFQYYCKFSFYVYLYRFFVEKWGKVALETSSWITFQMLHNKQALLHLF